MTDVLESIRRVFSVSIHKEGYPFILIGLVATILLAWLWWPLGWIGAILTVWVCYFFRDPDRITPIREGLVVSPADGRVSLITTAVPPPEMDLPQEPMTRVSVFMNVFDCHVNRSPVRGPDRSDPLYPRPLPECRARQGERGQRAQRAGDRHRRRPDRRRPDRGSRRAPHRAVRKSGDSLSVGERFGLIRFGSRVDVYLPIGAQVLVGLGQTSLAGETVLADLHPSEPGRQFRKG